MQKIHLKINTLKPINDLCFKYIGKCRLDNLPIYSVTYYNDEDIKHIERRNKINKIVNKRHDPIPNKIGNTNPTK